MLELPKASRGTVNKLEMKKTSSSLNNRSASRKHHRKIEIPTRMPTTPEQCPHSRISCTWVCKNSACRAVLSVGDTFCRRCSCCICHLFDDNKDPSLWLVCSTESEQGDSCGLSCHIECALQHGKVGVVDLGQLMQLDGSYCCASCGKVSGILECWKKQLAIARDARRVDVLCYRIYLSYRLLERTSRFKELHEIIQDAKAKLEAEVGPVNGISAKMARGIVCRLTVAGDVHKLCSLAIEKADQWLATVSNPNLNCREDSLPAACKFLFEGIESSYIVITLVEISNESSEETKGYKLWYSKSREEAYTKEPVCIFPRTQRRILISNLQPCTEYTFRIVSYSENGDVGHSEVKCFTKSVEITHNSRSPAPSNARKESPIEESSIHKRGPDSTTIICSSSGFQVRHLGKILELAKAQGEGCLERLCSADVTNYRGVQNAVKPETPEEEQLPPISRGLDLNVVSVPDLNEELTHPLEYSKDEVNGCTVQQAVEADGDAASHDIEKNGMARSNGSDDSQVWTCGPNSEVPAVDSLAGGLCRKRAASAIEETNDCDSTLINESPLRVANDSCFLDENFEYCVKIIRWLECEGHIKQDFRLKLLTWFSLRSSEQERRVINTFIQTLIDEPSSLAGQLVDSFSDIISCKKPRNGFCSKLWH
ncbi:VIN3-like protein 1 [Cucurbita argyrosperma subsp. argyrosperma]